MVDDPGRDASQGQGPDHRAGGSGHCLRAIPFFGVVAGIIRGEAINTGGTYGYDIVTMMQETKTSLCQVEPA